MKINPHPAEIHVVHAHEISFPLRLADWNCSTYRRIWSNAFRGCGITECEDTIIFYDFV
jgi:hypothetical protein